jgi:dihydropteroate synthase
MPDAPPIWRLANARSLALDRSRILAIVNATPDSFSDGGRFRDASHAAHECLRMLDDGADMLDIGGESTRPGALPVDDHEQIRRVIPVIERLRALGCAAPISVDTTRSGVARAALDAGADAINDQSACEDDPDMLPLVAERGAGLILMHRLRRPNEDSFSNRYGHAGERTPPSYESGGGVVASVLGFLTERLAEARRAGVAPDSLAIDPGLGFGKTVAQNLALVGATGEFTTLGYPVLCAASRKSFLGSITGVETPSARVEGSVAVAVAMRLSGAILFRVHDINAHRRALDVTDNILRVARSGPNHPEAT